MTTTYAVKVPVSHLSRESVRDLWHERFRNAFDLDAVTVLDESAPLDPVETREGWDCVEFVGSKESVTRARDRYLHHMIDTEYLPEDVEYPEILPKESK